MLVAAVVREAADAKDVMKDVAEACAVSERSASKNFREKSGSRIKKPVLNNTF